jgi:peptidoglycan/xylan/chitin deacetylase (PgdA/CDA1 family)
MSISLHIRAIPKYDEFMITKKFMLCILLCSILLFPAFAGSLDILSTSLDSVRNWDRASEHAPFNAVPERQDPKIVIFLYHNIVYGRTGNVYNRDIYNFAHDLAFIRRNFEVVSMDELADIRSGKRKVNTDIAVITFDDGDLSIYALAYPLLAEFGLPATFFLVPSYINTTGYISWEQAQEMLSYRDQDGEQLFSFGSHTMNHVYLGEVNTMDAAFEMSVSKLTIEHMLDTEVTALALPFGSGHDNDRILKQAAEAGYTVVRNSLPRAADTDTIDLLHIPALNVENYSSDELVRRTLKMLGR